MKKFLLFLCLLFAAGAAGAQAVRFPLKISGNKRYFTDADNRPFLYNADTGWYIFCKLTTEEAVEYMKARKAQGFNVIQAMLTGTPGVPDRYGHPVFSKDEDFSKPNQAYHDHVLRIIQLADSLNLLVVMSQPWLGCCEEAYGGRPDKPIRKNGVKKNRQYGMYLGKQFARCKNLFWIIGGDNDPKEEYDEILAFAEGLRATAPAFQLLTYHASNSHSSTDIFPYAPWLGFSMVYTYWKDKPGWVNPDEMPEVYEACLREYEKSYVIPFILGESQYEGFGRYYPNDIGTPQQVRRQAYWTVLCGGTGNAYGSDIWGFLPGVWRKQLKYEGANELVYFYRFFTSFPWYKLVPDIKHHFLVAGNARYGESDYVTAALTEDGKYAALYFPKRRTVALDFSKLFGKRWKAEWYSPLSGEIAETKEYETAWNILTPPGEGDWALRIEAEQ